MKNFKKLFSFVVSAAIAVSCMPMQAMAEGATEPEILFHRDYEDYKGGNHQWYSDGIGDYSGNNSKFYGTWNWSIDSVASASSAVDGYDGKAVQYKFTGETAYHTTNAGTFNDVKDGTLYYAFDMWGDPEEANKVMFVNLVGETDKEIYALCWNPGVQWCKESVSWMTGERSTDFMNGVAEKTRVELVIDAEAGTVDKYFNGNFAHQMTFTPQAITTVSMYISKGHTMDNFSVVHYPENYTDSFSITDAKVNMKDNSVSVFLNSNAYDSDGAQVKGDATFAYPVAAPYGVTLSSVDANSFTVAKGDAPLTVTGIEKGEANGEYVISVAEPVTAGTYTVAAADGLTDICSNVINPTGNAKTVSIETEPQVLVYRDFEDYQGGNGFSNTGQYGTFQFSFDKDFGWGNATKEVGRTGVGFQSNTTNQSLYNRKLPEDVRTAGSGYVYISITSEAIEGETRSGRFALSGKDGYRYFGFTHGTAYSTDQWTNTAMSASIPAELQNLDYYKIEVIFDLETGLQYNYINGQLIKTCTRNASADFVNGTFNFSFEDGVITDNLVMLYYPKNIVSQTFSLDAEEIDVENDTIKVAFTSDAVDSNGAKGAKIEAPYNVILKDDPTAEDFTVEGCTVVDVTPTGAFGEYVLTVAEDLQSGTVYNVSVNKALKDTFGAEFAGNTAEIQVITEADIFYYRDFEEYKGGNPWPAETSKDYGSKSLFGDRQFDSATKIKTAGGTGVKFGAMADGGQITEGTSLGNLTDGTLYISYNEMPGGGREEVYPNRVAGGNAGSNFWCWNGTNWASGNNNWSLGSTQGMKGVGVNHKIELVVDIAARKVYRYVDGVCVQPAGCSLAMTEYKDLTFRFADNTVLDDIAIVYFPEKLVSMPTFSVSAGNFDAEANTVSVFLNSDAVDSDANDTAYYAPYGVSLASFDASSFTVDGYTVTGVTKGEASGEYVLAIAEDFAEDAELKVTAADGLADILGSELNADAKSAVVKAVAEAEPVYTVSDITVEGGKASVTYTNTTDEAESFVLMVASYEGERLSEVNFEVVTAETDSVDVTKSVSLVNSVEGKTVKAFMFDSLTNLMPLK